MAGKKKERTGVLPDHTKRGQRLVPPLLHALGDKHAPYSWTRQLVPESIWIWLLIDRHGIKTGSTLADAIGRAAAMVSTATPTPSLVKLSAFSGLSLGQKSAIRTELGSRSLAQIDAALSAFCSLCPNCPLSFLTTGEADDRGSLETFSNALEALYDRYGRPAALTLATVTWMLLQQDKLRMPPDIWAKVKEDFANIEDYPNTERSKAAAASFRASAPMTLMLGDELQEGRFAHNEDWQKYFWDKVGTIGACNSAVPNPEDEDVPQSEMGRVVFGFRNSARRELLARLGAWKFDLHNVEVTDVISALLSRQTTLALDLALAPSIWNPHTAPLLVRAMADVFITFAWILSEDSKVRAARFVDDGLGAVKLEIAHRRNALEAGAQEQAAEHSGYIDMLQAWLDSQRLEQLVEVNLGSWSGMTVRAMAEESGYLDFYNHVYQPFSSAVHSNWFHVGRLNAVVCENPTHRHHRLGRLIEFDPDPHWLYLAAKYLDKMFDLFDRKTGTHVSVPSSFDELVDVLNEIGSSDEEASDESAEQ